MASPFKWFRKNQKAAFVVLGVMAMISFIVLPAFLQYMGGSGGADVTFATSRYGKIDGRHLADITNNVSNLARFYEQLGLEIGAQYQMDCAALRQTAAMLRSISQDDAVEQWLVAQYMRDQGFDVSREDVGAYLSRLTYNPAISQSYATETVYRKAVGALDGFNDRYVTYLVGNQMMVDQFYGMSAASVSSLTPAAEFDWHNRFNRKMKIEAIPISVSDFTSQVAAPTKKELKKFYEDNKFRDRNPMSVESGFSLPVMAAVEYVYYDSNMLRPEDVTDEEVEKYYEENKELFIDQPMTSPSYGSVPTPGMSGTFTFPVTVGHDAAIEETPEATAPVESPAEPVTEPATEKIEEPSAAEEETIEETTGWNGRRVPIRLVSYQSGEEADASEAPATDVAVPEEIAAETLESSETPSNESTPVITLQPGSLGGVTGFGSGLGGTTSPFGRTAIPNLGGTINPSLASTPVIYQPLDDTLRQKIRELIARQKMNEKLQKVQDAMSAHYQEHIKAIQQNKKQPLPDIASLAENLGLNYVNTGQVDYYDLTAKHFDFAGSFLTDGRFIPVSQGIFMGQGTVGEKRGARSETWPEGMVYVFWVTEFSEPRIPAYDEDGMAEQVEARWRMVESRQPARQKAEELAETAKKTGGSFVEYFSAHPNKDVKTMTGTEFFTWMTMANYAITFGEVCETGVLPGQSIRDNVVLKHLGEDFMQTVYNLEPGQIAVTHNEPQDTFYVVRLVETVPTDETAFDSFAMDTPDSRYVYQRTAMQDRMRKLQQGAMQKVIEKTNFKWKVKPSEYQQLERLKSQEKQPDRQSQGSVPPNIPRF